jgi:hypothetical protein
MKYVCYFLFFSLLGCKHAPIIFPEGGYAFINTDSIKDKSFPYYPIIDSISTYDSIQIILKEAFILKQYDEPNISLKPSEKEIFRMKIEGMGIPIYYITLTNQKIIAKKGIQIQMTHKYQENLNEDEKYLYQLLNGYLMIKERNKKSGRIPKYKPTEKRLIDSCKKIGIIKCYKYLHDKSPFIPLESFKYETKINNLSYRTYKKLVDKINNAGYWNLPLSLYCDNPPIDGTGFSLEANNGRKYNYVASGDCMDEPSEFRKACQEIINLAHLDKEIKIVYGNENN